MVMFVQKLAVQQLQSLDASTRVVVIHPNYVPQHLVLHTVLENAVYVRFHGHKLNSTGLKEQIESAITLHTGSAGLKNTAALILDECDRADELALDECLKRLIGMFNGRIILFSRYAPLSVLREPSLRVNTRFIPADEGRMLWDYAQRNDSGGILLEVRALGDGRVQLNGAEVKDWDGVLPRALFFYLVDRGMVTRSEIFETFWGNLTTREATNVFHVTKRKISEVLGTELTVYWSGFYHISPRVQLSYDVSVFTQLIQDSAVMPPEASIELVQQAVDVYRGDFLMSVDMPWVERRRQDLRQMYGESLTALPREKERQGKKHEALVQYLQAVATHRHREDLVQTVMQLYHEMGMHSHALAVYHRLKNDLASAFSIAPGRQLEDLAARIQGELGT